MKLQIQPHKLLLFELEILVRKLKNVDFKNQPCPDRFFFINTLYETHSKDGVRLENSYGALFFFLGLNDVEKTKFNETHDRFSFDLVTLC